MTEPNDRLDRIESTLDRLESMVERMGDRAVFRNRLDRLEEITADNVRLVGQLAQNVERVADGIETLARTYDRDRRSLVDLVRNHDRIINRQDEIIKLLTREVVGEPPANNEP
jgi:predicted nuclease with TOPRIM domain